MRRMGSGGLMARTASLAAVAPPGELLIAPRRVPALLVVLAIVLVAAGLAAFGWVILDPAWQATGKAGLLNGVPPLLRAGVFFLFALLALVQAFRFLFALKLGWFARLSPAGVDVVSHYFTSHRVAWPDVAALRIMPVRGLGEIVVFQIDRDPASVARKSVSIPPSRLADVDRATLVAAVRYYRPDVAIVADTPSV
jgi:hypothetical protein